jgi:hypothetical protein
MRKRTVAIPLSILAAGGLAGGAYAATQSSSNPQQAFLNDAAHRLHVTPARLSNALKQALIDRINAAVAAGRLTPAEGRAIKQRLEQTQGLPLLPGLVAPGPLAFHPGFPPVFGPPAILTSAASYLGLTDKQLRQQLRSGKSLGQIASARGRSTSGLEKAIVTALKSQLEKAVSAGRLSRASEQRLLSALTKRVPSIVNGHPSGFPFLFPGPPGVLPFLGGPGKLRLVPRAGGGLVGPPPGGGLPGLPPHGGAMSGPPPAGSATPPPPRALRGLI